MKLTKVLSLICAILLLVCAVPAVAEEEGGELSIPENAIYFDYSYEMFGNTIADTFWAEVEVWYPALGQEAYVPQEDSEEVLFTFTGTWCTLDCYANGTYLLTAEVSEYIKDAGTWSWENYQFTLTREKDPENPIEAAIKR